MDLSSLAPVLSHGKGVRLRAGPPVHSGWEGRRRVVYPTAFQLFRLCFPLIPCPWPWMSLSFPCLQCLWWSKERWMAAGGRIPTLLPCSGGLSVSWGVLGADGNGMRCRDWDEEEDEEQRWGWGAGEGENGKQGWKWGMG